jgi:hypothetical protein
MKSFRHRPDQLFHKDIYNSGTHHSGNVSFPQDKTGIPNDCRWIGFGLLTIRYLRPLKISSASNVCLKEYQCESQENASKETLSSQEKTTQQRVRQSSSCLCVYVNSNHLIRDNCTKTSYIQNRLVFISILIQGKRHKIKTPRNNFLR